METLRDSTGKLKTALDFHSKGLRLVPVVGKRAIVPDWPELHLTRSEVEHYFSQPEINIGIITGDPLIVLDTDSEEAEAWVRHHRIESPVIVRTGGGGFHRYFRCDDSAAVHSRSHMHGVAGLDLKAWHSYVVGPGSIHPRTGRRYSFLADSELRSIEALPLFQPVWQRERPVAAPRTVSTGVRPGGFIRNIRAYIRGIPSIDGQGGDRACFTVACLLVEAGFDYASALAELEAWNQERALGPWSRTALQHKLRYAFKRVAGVESATGADHPGTC